MTSTVSGFRTSLQQARLWKLGREGSPLLVQVCFWLRGPVHLERLQEALATAAERHDALRTRILRPHGLKAPLQSLGESTGLRWEVLEQSPDGHRSRQAVLDRVRADERSRVLDLKDGPALRCVAVRFSPDQVGLVLTGSALHADARSLEVLVEDAGRLYAGEFPGDAPVQYYQYSEWQNGLLEESRDRALAVWRDELDGNLHRLRLPFEREDGGEGASGRAPASVVTSLPADVVARLQDLASRQGASLETALFAAWQVLLWRLVEGRELVVAVARDGRSVEDLARVVGPVSRDLPLRVRLEADFRFSEVVELSAAGFRRIESAYDLFSRELLDRAGVLSEEETIPFAFDVGRLAPRRTWGGVEFAPAARWSWAEPAVLALGGYSTESLLELEIRFAPERIERADAELLAEHLGRLAASASRDPESPIGDLDVETEEGRRRLAAALRGSEDQGAPPSPVADGVAAVARARPDAVAVVSTGEHLSYGELLHRADGLGGRLAVAGVKPEEVVALPSERSVDALVAIVGVLRAGGAYLPVDFDLPSARVESMLSVAGVRVVLHGSSGEPAQGPGASRVFLPLGDPGAGPDLGSRWPEVPTLPESLAYVLFTSGSSGRPKGVAVEHRQLARYVTSIRERLELEPGEAFALASTLSADLGLTVVFPALATGGTLHLVPERTAVDPEAFARYMESRRIGTLKIVPSHLRVLMDGGTPGGALPSRRLILGGEAPGRELVESLLRLRPDGAGLFNHYGPTETTIGVTAGAFGLDGGSDADRGFVPLGSPLSGVHLRLVGTGNGGPDTWLPGELLIAGGTVARGYVGDPRQTAERFVPDPAGTYPGGRAYRTGDRVRLHRGGELEFVGRFDRQLKIRGFRVEAAEVEAVLAEHPEVREAVVTDARRGDGDAHGLLYAYVVPAPRTEPREGDLARFLQARLPEHMVPRSFLPIDSVPLSPNGKVDLAALPDLPATSRRARPMVAPRNDTEAVIAEMWCELLDLEDVSVRDGFFEVGGHSLLATQLLSRLRRTFSIDLPMQAVFREPTIERLAEVLAEREGAPGQVEKVARTVRKVEALSEEEVSAMLHEKRAQGGEGR